MIIMIVVDKLQLMLSKTKKSCKKRKIVAFWPKHCILVKSWHLTKIKVSVISMFP